MKPLSLSIFNLNKRKILMNSETLLKEQSPANEFWPSIVHELKTPLNAISGFSAVLEEELVGSNLKEYQDYVKEITFAANELNELVHDLLDLGQIASRDFAVDLSNKIDINEVIKRSVRLNHSYALKRNIRISLEVNENIKLIHLDLKRMKQILTNLISNALKYSPEQSEIKISCKNVFDSGQDYFEFMEISIIDEGFEKWKGDLEQIDDVCVIGVKI